MIIDAHAHIFSNVRRKIAPDEYPDGTFPVDRLIALMDRAGVDQAILVQNPTIGTVNDEVRAAVEAYPGRFQGVIQVDPLDERAPAVLRRYGSHPRQRIVKLEMSEEWGWCGIHPGIRLDGGALGPLWEAVDELELKVIIDPGAIGNPGYQVEDLASLSEAHPRTVFLLEHLGYLQKKDFADARAQARRLELLRLALRPNVYLGFSAVGILLDEDYPCRGALELLREAVQLAGARKILWGTDIPITLRRYTYRQMIDVVRREASFLSELDRSGILGGNAARVFFGAADH